MQLIQRRPLRGFVVGSIAACLLSPSSLFSQPAPGYYQTADTSSAAALKASLHEIIDDHTRFPYTSSATDTWNVLEIADEDQDNMNNVITIYENDSNGKEGGGNSFYNREHSWPKSYGFPDDGSSNYPYTDMHHLFIADSGYNSSRSNKPYDNCGSGCSEKVTLTNNNRGGAGGDSNWTTGSFTSGSWEVWNGRRGDVARAMFYMAVRYEGGLHGVTGVAEPDLRLTDNRTLIEQSNTGNNESVAYMGLLSTLLQWHQEDPVDLIEFQHNEAVASYQGNRNPFVDHPEWVACVFQDVCSGGSDTQPPAAPSGLTAAPDTSAINLNWFDNSEADLSGYHVYRSETSGGTYSRITSQLITASNYIDAGVSLGVTYYYVVTATDTSGNESGFSGQADAAITNPGLPAAAWINEFHYDDSGSDQREFVEIAGPTGTNVSGWQIIAYNGNGGGHYKTVTLNGTIADQQGCMGTASVSFSGLQNGSPDGIALVDDAGQVLDFISYEGSFTATSGPASGAVSTDIGVSESGTGSNRNSLQKGGTGSSSADFPWQQSQRATRDQVNTNQTFNGCGLDTTPPAVPSNLTAVAGNAEVQLGWSSVSDADLAGYNLYRSNQSGGGYLKINAGLLTAISFTDSGLTNGDTYYYRVTSVDDAGNESAQSSTVSATPEAPAVATAWINELHYDNSGSDVGEFVEVAGTAGLNLSGWTLLAYNGNGGGVYKTVNLSGAIPNQSSGFGVLAFDVSGLQNGAPDGVALIDGSGNVVEFLSYEGSFTGSDGAAAGTVSTNIGVSETSSTPIGYSLQRTGSGQSGDDFVWSGPSSDTYGSPNNGQSF